MRLASASDPLRILLVEDSKSDAVLIEKALAQAMGETYRLQRVLTLGEALSVLSEREFDVALLDRSLPDAEDYRGLHAIQNRAPKLPVIFLTAYRDEEAAFSSIEQGAQDYLFKDKFDGHAIKRSIQYSILRKQFESVLIVRANFDNLTGLANRMLFESRLDMALARMKRQGGQVGVLFLDLDRFKQINDALGHIAGDKLLHEVGARLKGCLRPYDTAARLGGDEFAVLIEGQGDESQCAAVARKIIGLFAAPFTVGDKTVNAGVSIGIAIGSGEGANGEELVRRADAAMYEAKSQPGSAFSFYGAKACPPLGANA